MLLLHHKNRKAAFWSVTLALTLLQGAALYFAWPYLPAPAGTASSPRRWRGGGCLEP